MRHHPVLGVLEITLLWHAVLIAVAEGLPPLAPDWWQLTTLGFLALYGFWLTRRDSDQPA